MAKKRSSSKRKTSSKRNTSSRKKGSRRKSSRSKKSSQTLIYSLIIISIVAGVYFFVPGGKAFINEMLSKTGAGKVNKGPIEGTVTTKLQLSEIEHGYPKIPFTDSEVLQYKGFHLSYNETHEQANWVAYILTAKHVKIKGRDRTDNFHADDNVSTESASIEDYAGSGYDRGHLAPAADMKWSARSMEESFLMSNMSPQNPSFNRGIWKELEEKVRDMAVANKSIYVITGPVLKDIKGSIGKNKISIPSHYYKVILDISPPDHKAIAFYLPNKASDTPLTSFAMSVDQLEAITGFDFFHHVNNPDMETIEAKFDTRSWGF